MHRTGASDIWSTHHPLAECITDDFVYGSSRGSASAIGQDEEKYGKGYAYAQRERTKSSLSVSQLDASLFLGVGDVRPVFVNLTACS